MVNVKDAVEEICRDSQDDKPRIGIVDECKGSKLMLSQLETAGGLICPTDSEIAWISRSFLIKFVTSSKENDQQFSLI